MTAMKSFATFSSCKSKDLLQLDLVYIHPVLSNWIQPKKQISGFQSNSTRSLIFKIRIPLLSPTPKVLDLSGRLKRHFPKNWKKTNQIIVCQDLNSTQIGLSHYCVLETGQGKFCGLLQISQAMDSNWTVSLCSICFLSSKFF